MITYKTGNILDSKCKILVNTVNLVGVMGAGVALAFKQKYGDEIMTPYRIFCQKRGAYQRIQMLKMRDGKTVCNFATKNDWKNPSEYTFIDLGLDQLYKVLIDETGPISIAFPKLGCGLGGLDWEIVLPKIIRLHDDLNLFAETLFKFEIYGEKI